MEGEGRDLFGDAGRNESKRAAGLGARLARRGGGAGFDFDIPESRGAGLARFVDTKVGADAPQRRRKKRDWLNKLAPEPIGVTRSRCSKWRVAVRYRPKDGDDKQLAADFSQTIAQDFQLESRISIKRLPARLRCFANAGSVPTVDCRHRGVAPCRSCGSHRRAFSPSSKSGRQILVS
jgi:hypothetical protein